MSDLDQLSDAAYKMLPYFPVFFHEVRDTDLATINELRSAGYLHANILGGSVYEHTEKARALEFPLPRRFQPRKLSDLAYGLLPRFPMFPHALPSGSSSGLAELVAKGYVFLLHGTSDIYCYTRECSEWIKQQDGPLEPRDYLILDVRQMNGDALLWWGPRNKGYTFDVDEAGRYTKTEAEAQRARRMSDFPVPAGGVMECTRRVVWRDELLSKMPLPYRDGRMPGDPKPIPHIDTLVRQENDDNVYWTGDTTEGKSVVLIFHKGSGHLVGTYGCDECGDVFIDRNICGEWTVPRDTPTLEDLRPIVQDHFTLPRYEDEPCVDED